MPRRTNRKIVADNPAADATATTVLAADRAKLALLIEGVEARITDAATRRLVLVAERRHAAPGVELGIVGADAELARVRKSILEIDSDAETAQDALAGLREKLAVIDAELATKAREARLAQMHAVILERIGIADELDVSLRATAEIADRFWNNAATLLDYEQDHGRHFARLLSGYEVSHAVAALGGALSRLLDVHAVSPHQRRSVGESERDRWQQLGIAIPELPEASRSKAVFTPTKPAAEPERKIVQLKQPVVAAPAESVESLLGTPAADADPLFALACNEGRVVTTLSGNHIFNTRGEAVRFMADETRKSLAEHPERPDPDGGESAPLPDAAEKVA